jgi:hypothetical protein
MTNLAPDEFRLDGRWDLVGGKTIADTVCERITTLVANHLEKVATTGWDTLYRDPGDGRYWELVYLNSHMHGGGPPSLVFIAVNVATNKYAFETPR